MPELPEVETICQGLRTEILNKTITQVYQLTNLKLRQEIPKDIVEKILNKKITQINRRSKYIQIFLDDELVMLIHLGMSGKLLIKNMAYKYAKHDHFAFVVNSQLHVVYNDPRRFGLIDLIEKDKLSHHDLMKNLGVEPLILEFTPKYLQEKLKQKKQPIKSVLMDNHVVVGVGNIYASESLFLSKISPLRAANSLSDKEIKLLHEKIIEVLKDSIEKGGSSLKDYASVSGEKGYFQNSFNVYAREGEDCKTCKNKIIKIKQAGRASFYCAYCQK
jgi:formamidopyrimidine-DNA glycosylase